MRFIVLNEATVVAAVWAGMLGRPFLLIGVHPLFPFSGGLLGRISQYLLARGWLVDVCGKWPEYAPFRRSPPMANTSDLYIRIEPSMEQRFHAQFPDLANIRLSALLKHAYWSRIESLGNVALLIAILANDKRLGSCRPVGAGDDMMAMADAYCGARPFEESANRLIPRLLNLCILMAIWAAALLWMLRHAKLSLPPAKSFFLGCTYVADPRVYNLLSESSPQPEQVCIFLHHDSQRETANRLMPAFATCTFADGAVPIGAFFGDLLELTQELSLALRVVGGHSPSLFLNVRKQAFIRLKYRALFRQRHFRWFWGKDDYDSVHITRNQELRRVGGRSVGHMHGFPVNNLLEPTWRHLDFDVYFLLCRSLYERCYKPHWPAHMKVIVAGPYGMTRQMLDRLPAPRPPNILFFLNPSLNDRLLTEAVLHTAEAFPDRNILVKIKPSRLKEGYFSDFTECSTKYKNIVLTQDNSYELMLSAKYAVGAISTTVLESLFYKCITFAIDVQPKNYFFHYRNFSKLCVSGGQELVSRIRAIEEGAEIINPAIYEELTRIDGENVFDIVRQSLWGAANT